MTYVSWLAIMGNNKLLVNQKQPAACLPSCSNLNGLVAVLGFDTPEAMGIHKPHMAVVL